MLSVFVTGQRTFGAAVLGALCDDGAKIVGVAAPGEGEDRLRHETHKRGLSWVPSEGFRAELVPEETDLIVAAHSHAFLSAKARSRSTHGAIGFHPSLLPRHRGRDAVRWTIHMRDPIAGGSVYYFTNNVDAGPILRQEWLHVHPKWNYRDLWNRLFPIGVDLLLQSVRDVSLDGGITRMTPQDEALATWEPSWERPPLHRPDLLELGR